MNGDFWKRTLWSCVIIGGLFLLLIGCRSSEPSTQEILNQASARQQQDMVQAGMLSPSQNPVASPLPSTGNADQQQLQLAEHAHQQSLERAGMRPQPPDFNPGVGAVTNQITEGDQSPAWVNRLPADDEYFYGLSFLSCPEKPNQCREKAETQARANLSQQFSVRIQSETRLIEKSQRSKQTTAFEKDYQNQIQEKSETLKLEEVSFEHFYLKPSQELQTLAKMPKKDRWERELLALLQKVLPKLPEKLQVGYFDVLGEPQESMLSFHTGEFWVQELIHLNRAETVFQPKKWGETPNLYWERLQKSENPAPVLHGRWVGEDGVELTVFLKENAQEPRFLDKIRFRTSSRFKEFSSTRRLGVQVCEACQSYPKLFLTGSFPKPESLPGQGEILQVSLRELARRLQETGFSLWNPEAPAGGAELQDKKGNLRRQQPLPKDADGLLLTVSLSGKSQSQSGFVYQGLTLVSLTYSVYQPEGTLRWSHTFEARRFLVEEPTTLSPEALKEAFLKTAQKGLQESWDILVQELLKLNAPSGTPARRMP
ncbi:MAG: LPP20 family lipoprotein [SAR324 cluster bacterium]|nr:LPP20 family lipoprotein [SAR324 cluster bacterium]